MIKSNNKFTAKEAIPKKLKSTFKNKTRLKKLRDRSKDRSICYSQKSGFIQAVPKVFNTVIFSILKDSKYIKIDQKDVDEYVNTIVRVHNDLIKNHGTIAGTKRFNDIRLYTIRLVEGSNPENPGRLATGKKDKFPSILTIMRPLYYSAMQNCRSSDRAIRSLLYINRLCEGNNKVDLSTIIETTKIDQEFLTEFRLFLRTQNLEKGLGELISQPLTKVLTSGPNSKPKWQTVDVEAYALLNSELHESFLELCKSTNNMSLYEYMKARADSFTPKERAKLRYITSIADKGNKSRIVAIGDYWTCVLLEPIMLDLKGLIEDRFKGIVHSNDHNAAFENLCTFIKPGHECYDMQAWTDLFNAIYQYYVMEERYGSNVASSWWSLCVRCEWNVKGMPQTKVKYNTGQGMGIPVSFDIATLTDALLLKFGYRKYYNKTITKALVQKVGDDLACFDPKGYIRDMYTSKLFMPIQVTKTKSATLDNNCGEIVSRNINYGVDVSRISANICRAAQKNPLDIAQLCSHLEERGVINTLNLNLIFQQCGIKERNTKEYVRTFFALTTFYNERTGMKLLKNSLIECFPAIIESDTFINLLRVSDYSTEIRVIFNMYQGSLLYLSIQDKVMNIFDACSEFDSSELLRERSDLSLLWSNTEESIEMLTSKIMLSKSFSAHNELYSAPDFESAYDLLQTLESLDNKLTFKDLGVISTTGEQWRPKTTKCFNFCKQLVVPSTYHVEILLENILTSEFPAYDIKSLFYLKNDKIDLMDPIFKSIKYIDNCIDNILVIKSDQTPAITGKGD